LEFALNMDAVMVGNDRRLKEECFPKDCASPSGLIPSVGSQHLRKSPEFQSKQNVSSRYYFVNSFESGSFTAGVRVGACGHLRHEIKSIGVL